MLPTPSTSHIDPEIIYDPAEDSFLLLDTLSSPTERHFLTQRFRSSTQHHHPPSPSPTPLIIEVGTGSGVILAFLTANAHEIFGRTDILTLGTDINPYACRATWETVRKACREKAKEKEKEGGRGKPTRSEYDGVVATAAAGFLFVLNSDLATAIKPKMVDVLVFNPPYVPTDEVELVTTAGFMIEQSEYESTTPHQHHDNNNNYNHNNQNNNNTPNAPPPNPVVDKNKTSHPHLLTLSYAGGPDGMQITNKLLNDLPNILNHTRGVAYILLCKQNKPDEVIARVRRWGAEWAVDVVGRSGKMSGWEVLVVVRIWRV